MKNTLLTLVIIVIVLALGWYVFVRDAEVRVATEEEKEMLEEEGVNPIEESDEDSVATGDESKDLEDVEKVEDQVIMDISGKNFEFSETVITVKKGEMVTINFESTEGFHDFVIDEFDAATDQVRPGTPTSVTFVADQTGEFEYYCSVGTHRELGMVGTLVVEE